MDVSPALRRVVDALPGGDYDRQRADAELRRIQQEEGIWRDESRLPLEELNRAMARSGYASAIGP